MKNILKIGLVIADNNEYDPLVSVIKEKGGEFLDIYNRPACKTVMSKDDRFIEIIGILCGVGKVNAAAATAYLAGMGVDMIINTGLSGGMSGIGRGEVTLGTIFVEHDFDLTPLGYAPSKKPDSESVHTADKLLNEHFMSLYPTLKAGTMVTGDCFVSDDTLRKELVEHHGAMSCDMESAAVAAICHDTGLKFAAVRRISDDAGNDADSLYTAAKGVLEQNLVDIVLNGISAMFDNDEFWK